MRACVLHIDLFFGGHTRDRVCEKLIVLKFASGVLVSVSDV